jgi:hypothetical protein
MTVTTMPTFIRSLLLLFAIELGLAACGADDTPGRASAGSGGSAAGGSGGGAGSSGTGGSVGTGGDTSGSGGTLGSGGGTGGGAGSEPDAAAETDGEAPPPDAAGPGDAAVGNRHAVIVWGYGEHKPTPKPTDPPMGFDMTMKGRLEAKGLIVDMAEDAVSKVADVTGKALLVISSSINRDNLFDGGKPRFKDVAVPTIVMKDGTIEVMGLGAGSAGGFSTEVGQTQLTIIAPGDPLAAGLTGNVTVYTKGDRLIWAKPGPAAKNIATIVGHADEIGIFAYAAGATMVGGAVAPAKRMGFFIHRNTDYSPDGIKLFDAAVDYLLAP